MIATTRVAADGTAVRALFPDGRARLSGKFDEILRRRGRPCLHVDSTRALCELHGDVVN